MSKTLEELAKQDARWRGFALKICGNKDMADDLTQEMYLRMHEQFEKGRELNSGFIYRAITYIFLDKCKKPKRTESIDGYQGLSSNDEIFEPDDYEQSILDKFNELNWIDQDLIQESYDRSLREIQQEYPMIHHGFAQRRIRKSVEDIFGEDFEEKYTNQRNKRK